MNFNLSFNSSNIYTNAVLRRPQAEREFGRLTTSPRTAAVQKGQLQGGLHKTDSSTVVFDTGEDSW
jgi:hypothetical protein